MRIRWILAATAAALGPVAGRGASETPTPIDPDALYQAGQQLFEQYAPPEVKAQFAFPTKPEWDAFADRLQQALDHDSLADLAALEPEARAALTAARVLPGYGDYADWLQLRLDEIEAARQAAGPRPLVPGPPARRPGGPVIPLYDLWLARVRGRPLPAGAAALMPRLRAAFAAEGVPPELAWLAEAESGLNPAARSPAGAQGLFQLMPDTAHALGLGTFWPDDRSDPEKSARAAAHYLKALYGKFGSWPLALAAYNAGAGRVSRALASRGQGGFSAAAPILPTETRMYVPKVLALVHLRTGMTPAGLPPPRG